MSISLSLKPRVLRSYDPDASSYISSVETADNQALEQPIKEAITEFVVGCKIRGIWDSIKSCCLLCGARTLNGAVVPLKGNAPILTSFVGDYNRETGLRRTSGMFDTNRNNNADPADNRHIAIYPTSIQFGVTSDNFIPLITSNATEGWVISVASLGVLVRNRSVSNFVIWQPVTAGNLIGASVNSSSSGSLLYNNIINNINITTSPTLSNTNIFLMLGSTSNRVSFYSIGERLNLKLLQQTLDQFNNRIWQAFRYSMTDSEASSYVSKVESVDQSYLPNPVRLAIDNFVIGCKSDNIWNSIKASNILCGAKTINAILVPLVGIAPFNQNFNNIMNYSRGGTSAGLKGNGTNTALVSNRSNIADPQDNFSMCAWVSEVPTVPSAGNTTFIIGVGTGTQAGTSHIQCTSTPSIIFRNRSGGGGIINGTFVTGLWGSSRNNSSALDYIGGGSVLSSSVASSAPFDVNIRVFGSANSDLNLAVSNYSNPRLSFYSIGEYMDLSLLNSRVSSLISSISSAL